VDVNRGRAGVAGAGTVAEFLDAVAVATGAFDRAWTGPVTPGRVDLRGDLGEDMGQGVVPVLRVKNPVDTELVVTSCGLGVFVYQPTEQIATSEAKLGW
jgi:hypothetical protein